VRRLAVSIVYVVLVLTLLALTSGGPCLAASRDKEVETCGSEMSLDPTIPPPPRPVRVRFSGRVDALPPGLLGEWVIAGMPVEVSEDTTLKPKGYEPKVGDWAEVKAISNYEGPLVASQITLQDGSQIPEIPVEFKGVIESVDESSLTVGGIIVRTDGDTATVGTPAVGLLAKVEGLLMPDGSVLAQQIQVLDPSEVRTEFEGPIEQLPPFPYHGEWIIGGIRVLAKKSPLGPPPRVGLHAEVTGVVDDDGLVHADAITVVDPSPDTIEGIVEHIDETEWTIGGVVVTIHRNTLVDESRASAEVGMWAEATVKHRGNATPLALRIRLERPW
jgi:SepF-like predicted cell division protein (DUF552 family)